MVEFKNDQNTRILTIFEVKYDQNTRILTIFEVKNDQNTRILFKFDLKYQLLDTPKRTIFASLKHAKFSQTKKISNFDASGVEIFDFFSLLEFCSKASHN